jgi:hypothetical protein
VLRSEGVRVANAMIKAYLHLPAEPGLGCILANTSRRVAGLVGNINSSEDADYVPSQRVSQDRRDRRL